MKNLKKVYVDGELKSLELSDFEYKILFHVALCNRNGRPDVLCFGAFRRGGKQGLLSWAYQERAEQLRREAERFDRLARPDNMIRLKAKYYDRLEEWDGQEDTEPEYPTKVTDVQLGFFLPHYTR